MAEVFSATIVGTDGFARRVAIKRVLPGFADNEAFARMFIAEAKISSRLQHANIVSVLDFDRDPSNRPYLVMELVEGRDLAALSHASALPIAVVLYVIAEVLRGLGHAHDLPIIDDEQLKRSATLRHMKGVVHRDVSPHNVLLSWDGAVKVSDFGIAKARMADNATATEFLKGKPSYMSPEQANGEELDGRSDLFAVGVMLWELLCNRRLFAGDDTRAILAAVLFKPIPSARTLRAEVPKDVERILSRLLERERTKRFDTAEQALAELVKCVAFPKNGRELLATAMRERFPAEAPVRHSMARERRPTDAVPEHIPTYDRPTVSIDAAPAHAAASIGFVPRRRPWLVPLVIGTTLLAIVLIAVLARGKYAPIERPDAGTVALALSADAAVIEAPTNDSSATIVAPDAAVAGGVVEETSPPADAGVALAPPRDASVIVSASDASTNAGRVDAGSAEKTQHPASTLASSKRGTLVVRAFPALTVYIDGRRIHDTPLTREIGVGRHRLRLVNLDTGHDETVSVTITDGQTTTIERL